MPAGSGPALTVIGLMSGTSADGIDAVVVRLPPTPALDDARSAIHHYAPYTAAQREAVHGLFQPRGAGADVLCRMNFLCGEWFAAAAIAAMAGAGLEPEAVDVIGSHGQTVYHCPPGASEAAMQETPCTLQIGEPAVIAERTGVTTVADFRVRDVAAGGHGAPLVSFVDVLLFQDERATRVVLNLGGIANVTIVPPARSGRPAIAFDTGPGNMVLDWLALRVTGGAQTCDRDGLLAAQGRPDQGLLRDLLADPYFRAPPPKTTGRERYGAAYAERLWAAGQARGLSAVDLLAMAAALTAQTVADGIRSALEPRAEQAGHGRAAAAGPLQVIAGGGGTRNPVLMGEIARRLPEAEVLTHEAFGISSQAKEALSFAILAAAAVRGEPNAIPSCTGARRAVVLGKIVPGQNYASLMRRLFGG
jgi:anhydro-N-acetylmuramic acid kinase